MTQAGEPTAHWSYLYTLYLTVVYQVVGIHPLATRIIQAVAVGILMPWLAYRLGKRVFPGVSVTLLRLKWDVGMVAALWIASYGYFIYYAAALMTESFYITGILWVLDCSVRMAQDHSRDGKSLKRWIELGLATGVTVLLRQVFLLVLPVLLAWVIWVRLRAAGVEWRRMAEKSILGILIAYLVVSMMIAPFTIFNYQQFDQFVLLNTNAGYAFFWANHPIHEDQWVSQLTPDMPSYQELIPEDLRNLDEAALERALMQRGLAFVFDNPWRYIKLSISRIADHFIFWPLPESSLISNLTRVGSFGIALPFMVLGSVIWLLDEYKRSKNLCVMWTQPGGLLLLFIFVYVLVHLLSWAGIRYRLPTDAVGLVFASGGLVWILKRVLKV